MQLSSPFIPFELILSGKTRYMNYLLLFMHLNFSYYRRSWRVLQMCKCNIVLKIQRLQLRSKSRPWILRHTICVWINVYVDDAYLTNCLLVQILNIIITRVLFALLFLVAYFWWEGQGFLHARFVHDCSVFWITHKWLTFLKYLNVHVRLLIK